MTAQNTLISQPMTIEKIYPHQVIIKVNTRDALSVAQHPYLSSDMAYITVQRGSKQIISIVKTDGTSKSYKPGYLSEFLEEKIHKFLTNNYIIMSYTGEPVGPTTNTYICYNINHGRWQLQIHTYSIMADKTVDTIDKMKDYCKHFFNTKSWKKSKSSNGYDIYIAEEPEFYLK